MGRNRVLSFMSQWSNDLRGAPTIPTSSPATAAGFGIAASKAQQHSSSDESLRSVPRPPPLVIPTNSPDPSNGSAPIPAPSTPVSVGNHNNHNNNTTSTTDSPSQSPSDSPVSVTGRNRSGSRPVSILQTYQPHVMDGPGGTLPELQPIFTLLNSHSNKLYQEGYFLMLDDQDTKGAPVADRTWTECFAQLVGTVLSLWDAAELDAVGPDGEVLPRFLNLTDASIKMIESLPTRSGDDSPLQNILSISTAGRNRYLLHFNSHHSLIQWTAGIRLAMHEHSTLQEAYTGALIAGKGKSLNNINIIMERARVPIQEWVRVRFGAGVPWRRCFCVIDPPSDKDYQKAQKNLKKKSPYDRSQAPVLKGQIHFFDTRRDAEKKKKYQKPIVTITDAFSSYALYPQSKALIENSTLLKVEGNMTFHTEPATSSEGFVFIMPEAHPAVSGIEMLLRFLFPTWDTFGLYGRPGRLVASSLDTRSLMFAMPKNKRQGYLEPLDVSSLILADRSASWTEREWRSQLKKLTAQRMATLDEASASLTSRSNSRSSKRLSFGPGSQSATAPRAPANFLTDGSSATRVRSSRSMSPTRPGPRTNSVPPVTRQAPSLAPPSFSRYSHDLSDTELPSEFPNMTNGHGPNGALASALRGTGGAQLYNSSLSPTPERVDSDDEGILAEPTIQDVRLQTPEPVNKPPAFAHGAGAHPQFKPYQSPELRKANSRLSVTTLSQLATAGGLVPNPHRADGLDTPVDPQSSSESSTSSLNQAQTVQARAQGVHTQANDDPKGKTHANTTYGPRQVLSLSSSARQSPAPALPAPRSTPRQLSQSPMGRAPLPSRPVPPVPGSSSGSQGNGSPSIMDARNPTPFGPPNQLDDSRMRATPTPGPADGDRASPGGQQQQQQQPSSRPTYPSPNPGPSPRALTRKPVPPRNASMPSKANNEAPVQSAQPSASSVSANSFSNNVFQGLRDVQARTEAKASRAQAPAGRAVRQDTDEYDDAESYSSYPTNEAQEPVERPRAGVLKTTGDSSNHTPACPGALVSSSTDYDIPDINFGPTLNYAQAPCSPPRVPRESISPNAICVAQSTPPETPNAVGRTTPGRKSPGLSLAFHGRSESEQSVGNKRRSVLWQPGVGARPQTPSAERALSAEQFVKERAAAASANPMYSTHHRNPSAASTVTLLRNGTKTPEFGTRSPSRANHSRHSSADRLSAVEMPSHLSAREQEHIARVTGTPLIAMAGGRTPPRGSGIGLVAAIETREREKVEMKKGYSGMAVAQAIDQRQREQNQLVAQKAAQFAYVQQVQKQQQQAVNMDSATAQPGMNSNANMRSMSSGPSMMGQMGGPQQMTSPLPNQMTYAPQRAMSPGSFGGPLQQPGAGGWGVQGMANSIGGMPGVPRPGAPGWTFQQQHQHQQHQQQQQQQQQQQHHFQGQAL